MNHTETFELTCKPRIGVITSVDDCAHCTDFYDDQLGKTDDYETSILLVRRIIAYDQAAVCE